MEAGRMRIRRRDFIGGAGSGLLLSGLVEGREGLRGPAPRRIRIGQIGVGHGHATKLAVYRASPDYEVVGVVEPDAESRARAASQPAFRDLPWMTRDQLLETPGVEAVLVETRVGGLLEAAEACVAAGKHVHLDKPAGASLPRYRRLLDDAAKRGLMVQMGYMFRYNPAVVLLRQVLAKGWLGEPFEVHGVMSKVVGAEQRRQLAEFTGGMMFELGCHLIDLVVGVLGKPDGVSSFSRHAGAVDDGLMDNALAVFSYPKALASVKSSAMEVDGFARRHFVVCGTEGTFHIEPLDDPAARVTFAEGREGYAKGYQTVSFPKYERYVEDAAEMARVIRGEKSAEFTFAHDQDVQEAVLRASGMDLD